MFQAYSICPALFHTLTEFSCTLQCGHTLLGTFYEATGGRAKKVQINVRFACGGATQMASAAQVRMARKLTAAAVSHTISYGYTMRPPPEQRTLAPICQFAARCLVVENHSAPTPCHITWHKPTAVCSMSMPGAAKKRNQKCCKLLTISGPHCHRRRNLLLCRPCELFSLLFCVGQTMVVVVVVVVVGARPPPMSCY